jgi:hypothetical protein
VVLHETAGDYLGKKPPALLSTGGHRIDVVKIVNLFETHRNAAIHWFQNGHPMKSWITDSEEMLGVSEKQAEKFSREWYNIKRQETSALWAQRQDIPKGTELPWPNCGSRWQR